MMSWQGLQEQVLHLSVSDRLNLMNFILQSLTHELNQKPETSTETLSNVHSLRGLPIQIAHDFDEPLTELWEALKE
ncbi:hypothetical protein [Vacuolonema iberomarrocanum]|uniref:hypothetical protein n=1 Tax=Vacuolonema iberomarrocanum TaxID=3454632 RepID=UPI001A0D5658|nr:hypothetical protein [filamentous cyanobacterium LEGE 07170]